MRQRRVFPKHLHELVKGHKYSGEDKSISNRYIISPIAAYLVNKIPRSVAPNLITIIASLFFVIPYLYVELFVRGNFASPMPPFGSLFIGLGFSLYTLLDNMDGKQARRTNTSSPLGMLLDHGSDAFCAAITTLNLAYMLMAHNTYLVMLACSIGTVPFYYATLESYYIGGVFLPFLNGASEGAFIITGLGIALEKIGSQVMLTKVYGVQLNEYVAISVVLS